jgi:hypothetical protein
MTERPGDLEAGLAPVRAMIAVLPAEAVAEIGRALHGKLNAPPTAAEHRVSELSFLARLLDEQPQHPDRLPYISRKQYEARRATDSAVAPPAARLQERFGSWSRACHAAWGLLEDGRCWAAGDPWPRPTRHPKNYTVEEAAASVRACTHALDHAPSSQEYHRWILNRRRRARTTGEDARPYVHYASIMRLLAPDRSCGDGWRLALSRAFDNEPHAIVPTASRLYRLPPRASDVRAAGSRSNPSTDTTHGNPGGDEHDA